MPRSKDEAKVIAIFDATLSVVMKTGFNGLKMADVAKKAGLATGTVYLYFKNKEALINALYLHLKTEKTQAFMLAYNPADDFKTAFTKLWQRYFDISLAEPERMLFIEQFTYTSYLTRRTKEKGDVLLYPLFEFLQEGIRKKKIKSIPLPLLISQLMGPIFEIVKLHYNKKIKVTTSVKKSLLEFAWKSVSR